jgi:hypothetical protein
MLFRVGAIFVLASRLSAGVNPEQMDEYRVKAAFLYNFAKFVDWPEEAFRNAGEPFSVCILGADPFGRALDEVVAGKAIAGRPLAVRRIPDAHQSAGCHILFVSPSAGKQVLPVLAAAKQCGILTVGEAGSSGSEGMVINFILASGKVRFEINVAAAADQKLRVSSRLLSLATTIRNNGQQ